MDGYLTTIRRRRKLVASLVEERTRNEEHTKKTQQEAVNLDAKERKMFAHLHTAAGVEQAHRNKIQFEKTRIKRLRTIRGRFMTHAATRERQSFYNWTTYLTKEKEKRKEEEREKDMEQVEETRMQAIEYKNKQQLAKLVHDAHQPRRSNTRENKSLQSREHAKLLSAQRRHHEKTNLIKIQRPYEIIEGRWKAPMKLMIRPMPKILDPPSVDRPEYPTADYIASAQAEDPLLSCILLYLTTPLLLRDGQAIIEEEVNEKRQGMDDETLFRKRQDGHGLGMEKHMLERTKQRERVREEYLLQLFHHHDLHLPIKLKVRKYFRPITSISDIYFIL